MEVPGQPPMHDPFLESTLPEMDPMTQLPVLTHDPLRAQLARVEELTTDPPKMLDISLTDQLCRTLDQVEESSTQQPLGLPDGEPEGLLGSIEQDVEGTVVPQGPIPEGDETGEQFDDGIAGVRPANPGLANAPQPLEDTSFGHAAHKGLLPPDRWSQRIGSSTGARTSSGSAADEEEQCWCLWQNLMVGQEECAECEYGEDPDGSGHFFCTYEYGDEEAAE